eukprot:m.246805 g.246805  ORF g.246805 m.246805 type:complete len:1258 (+) comp26650_c0_seq16:589-4362(+)
MDALQQLDQQLPPSSSAPTSSLDPNADFSLLEVGTAVEAIPTNPASPLPLSVLPCGLPPALCRDKDPATIHAQLRDQFLFNLTPLAIHDPILSQRHWPRKTNPLNLQSIHVSPARSTFAVKRNIITGDPEGFSEVSLQNSDSTAINSLSMQRKAGDKSNATFGLTTNKPFLPGGFVPSKTTSTVEPTEQIELEDRSKFCDVPPGFENGIPQGFFVTPERPQPPAASKTPVVEPSQPDSPPSNHVISIADILTLNDEDLQLEDTTEEVKPQDEPSEVEDEVINMLSKPDSTESKLASHQKKDEKETWVIEEDPYKKVTDFEWQVPEMAFTYPFELDTFQKLAVIHLERHESVFVAAHTSAGKTVVAEYAIALCAKHMTRCIYTSPIKALSNQKFRDFRQTFEDVGLLTGDVQIKPEASCLIMTTEILRSMLYRGADMVRDVEWVIFDEVHYINDADRGVVWEEVIIMLPDHVNIIMLSATVPNTVEFADWVGRTKKKKMFVISTMKRPVPLEHFLYTGSSTKTASELFKLVDSNKKLLDKGYKDACEAKKSRTKQNDKNFGPRGGHKGAKSAGAEKTLYISFVNMLKKKGLAPMVIFTFSKKRCEQNATALMALDLTSQQEKSDIHVFIETSVNRLKGSDRTLPQVLRMRDMLKRGIGVHHSGLLPIIKEMVELLFGKGLIKVLFATETFAMGVNMPAKAVAFDSTRKYDGGGFRDLMPGEYVQMAGRAGRRGLDDTGTVVIICKGDMPDLASLKMMILGKPTKLQSRFRLTYNMILNLLRVEELRVEDMMKRSFSEFHTQRDASEHEKELEAGNEKLQSVEEVQCDFCVDLAEYYKGSVEVLSLSHSLQETILAKGSKVLSSGRVVVVNNAFYRNSLAVILRQARTRHDEPPQFDVLVIRDVIGDDEAPPDTPTGNSRANDPLPVTQLFLPQGALGFDVTKVNGMDFVSITKSILKFSTLEVCDRPRKEAQSKVAQQLLRLAQANPSGLPTVDPVKDLKIKDLDFVDHFRRRERIQAQLLACECTKCPEFVAHYAHFHLRSSLNEKIKDLQYKLSDKSLHLLPEYESRVEVLKYLNYVDDDCAVQLKGRVACEVSTCDEIIATELVFENVLTPLEPEEIVALLSCLVFQEKNASAPKLTPVLETGVQKIKEIATRVALAQLHCKLDTPVNEYIESLHFGLVEVVHEWARGTPFSEITDLTDVLEGSIVRCIVRLDETCRDVRNAARVIGDPVLYQKMDQASTLIKRDIVFAASLYTT